MRPIDETHQPGLISWIESANDSSTDFPLQNLPFCRFTRDAEGSELGVGIGDQILSLKAATGLGLFDGKFDESLNSHRLNEVMALSVSDRYELRTRISQLLNSESQKSSDRELKKHVELCKQAIVSQSEVRLLVPCEIADYTDFYASVFHATNVGSMFRPNNPILPNYKHIPIGYHGRASSIIASEQSIRRPSGQLSPAEEGGSPSFGPCKMLDYELEVGVFIAEGNELGQPISIDDAEQHLFGLCLVNDWSARDIQKWEYQPLGPFLAKSFATSVSPWVVTLEALAPFRCQAFDRPPGDPQPLDYLTSQGNTQQGSVNLQLEVLIRSRQMREQSMEPLSITRGTFRNMYWTLAQMLTHHSSNGCNLRPGDLLASGTVSGPERESRGCLLELTWDGDNNNPVPGTQRTPLELPTGEQRKFLQNGDEVIFRGICEAEDFRRIGFGSVSGTIADSDCSSAADR